MRRERRKSVAAESTINVVTRWERSTSPSTCVDQTVGPVSYCYDRQPTGASQSVARRLAPLFNSLTLPCNRRPLDRCCSRR